MKKSAKGELLYSATDLVRFAACRHHTALDLIDQETPLRREMDDPEAELVQEKGIEHELRYLELLKDSGLSVAEIPDDGELEDRVALTLSTMREGADIVFQAGLLTTPWSGHADFLRKVKGASKFGDHGYEVIDTKLARNPKPSHLIQLAVYSDLLAELQGVFPRSMHLVLGDEREVGFRVADYTHYVANLKTRFEAYCENTPMGSYPEPCSFCGLCRWRTLCDERWNADDHLSLVAGIGRRQMDRLRLAGIETLDGLACLTPKSGVDGIGNETLERIRCQAVLQLRARKTGENHFEILPAEQGRGFARLPVPDSGDVFFDIEGDPLYPDGLEYLLGLHGGVDEGWIKAFWAHDHYQEKLALEGLMDFLEGHMAQQPGAHVYHYGSYEPSVLKRLSSRYGTREAVLDDLLRRHKFVDLLKVVREGLRASTPGYSLKDLEVFYREEREGEVTSGGQSIVIYEKWRRTGEQQLLDDIAAYNEIDCRSTRQLCDWLLERRPESIPWFGNGAPEAEAAPSERVLEMESEREACEAALLRDPPREERDLRVLVSQLLEFHRREAKPQWWAMFDRQDKTEEELVDDAECLGGLVREGEPEIERRSYVFTYRFPPQDHKLRENDACLVSTTLERAGTIVALDAGKGVVRLKRGMAKGELPERMSVVPTGPFNTARHRAAIYRFARSLIDRNGCYRALCDLLSRETPRLMDHTSGTPIIEGDNVLGSTVSAVSRLDNSYLFIQGPPGAGKTYTAAHVILDLISDGKRVGVTSNSHKAVDNLLGAVERRAMEANIEFSGVKKASAGRPDTEFLGRYVSNVTSNDGVADSAQLVGGTSWLFSDERFDQAFDYLFVDEAGQVAVANIVAMGMCARNIVLVGDQMQLAQPIQGTHPGESGMSVLEYLLREQATIPPARGIFLPTTWRMHGDVCQFISKVVYDGRLRPEPDNERQRLVLTTNAHRLLAPTGIRFAPVAHTGCAQKSEEEAKILRKVHLSLLGQRYIDREGQEHKISVENILVVSPYNVQVNHLTSVLPSGTRVGTVDKFQGQEAEVVLVSMATSSGQELPRDIEFLYSRNRLNVAISRARCLAIVFASPRLLEVDCRTVEQMRLVNTMCAACEYGSD